MEHGTIQRRNRILLVRNNKRIPPTHTPRPNIQPHNKNTHRSLKTRKRNTNTRRTSTRSIQTLRRIQVELQINNEENTRKGTRRDNNRRRRRIATNNRKNRKRENQISTKPPNPTSNIKYPKPHTKNTKKPAKTIVRTPPKPTKKRTQIKHISHFKTRKN